jgi:hypothetical protein
MSFYSAIGFYLRDRGGDGLIPAGSGLSEPCLLKLTAWRCRLVSVRRRSFLDPCRPGERVVDRPAYDGGAAIGRKRDGLALVGYSWSTKIGPDQLRPLLRELRQRQL